MADIWFVSDTHFGHARILTFKLHDGTPMRPFATVEEMDETLVANWNAVVKPADKVYHLGDVAMHKRSLPIVGRCHGHKRLVRGNHDVESTREYLKYFEEIHACRVLDNCLFTHIPVHPESLRATWTNVHGHVHNNVPALYFGQKYLNISVEVTEYRPLHFDEVRQRAKEQIAENARLIEERLSSIKNFYRSIDAPILDEN
jgi:calcineurin-like phosphoesterase family protein